MAMKAERDALNKARKDAGLEPLDDGSKTKEVRKALKEILGPEAKGP